MAALTGATGFSITRRSFQPYSAATLRLIAPDLIGLGLSSKPDGSAEAYRRYKEPLDRLADYVLDQLALSWSAA